jgi:hypothetical protein
MDDAIRYKYRVKGKKISSFDLAKDFVMQTLHKSEDEHDKQLHDYIKDNNLVEITDTSQIKFSYRMRHVLDKCSVNEIYKYYCPFCDKNYDGGTLRKEKKVVDKGGLRYGEENEYYCNKNHLIFWVRGLVS